MKKEKLDSYLKAYRKQSGLTQKEVTCLLGKKSISVISRMENGHATPSFETAIYLSILYRESIADLIPLIVEKLQYQLLKRLDCMNTEYTEHTNTKTYAKRSYLENIINDIASSVTDA
jgi:transcriptional regulator with XRE-family HTH domain